jgi:hypothetical protein
MSWEWQDDIDRLRYTDLIRKAERRGLINGLVVGVLVGAFIVVLVSLILEPRGAQQCLRVLHAGI